MKIKILLMVSALFTSWAFADTCYIDDVVIPNIVLGDSTGTAINGVSGSETALNAAIKARQLGVEAQYTLLNPTGTVIIKCVASTPPDPVDSDGDGVADDIDQCPGTAQGVEVDAVGCEILPPDADGDGIPDVDDECPNDATNTCNDPPPAIGEIPAKAIAYLDQTIDQAVVKLSDSNRVESLGSPFPSVFPVGLPYKMLGSSGPEGILTNWTGAAFDAENLVLTLGGGHHNGYFGNDVTSVYLKTGAVIRHNDPGAMESLYLAGTGYQCWIQTDDNEPMPNHGYDGPIYDPGTQLVFFISLLWEQYYSCSAPTSPDFDANDPRLKNPALNVGIYAFNRTGETRFGIEPGKYKKVHELDPNDPGVLEGQYWFRYGRGFIHPDGDIVIGGWNEVWKGRMNPATNMLDLVGRWGGFYGSQGFGVQNYSPETNTTWYSTNEGVIEHAVDTGAQLRWVTKTSPCSISSVPYTGHPGELIGFNGADTLCRFKDNKWYIYDLGGESVPKLGEGWGKLYSKLRYIAPLHVLVAVIDAKVPIVVIRPPEDINLWTPLSPVTAQSFIDAASPGDAIVVAPGAYN